MSKDYFLKVKFIFKKVYSSINKIVLKSYKDDYLSDEPARRSLSPPDLAKNEIIVEIKNHLNSRNFLFL